MIICSKSLKLSITNLFVGFKEEGYFISNITGYPGNWSFLNITVGPYDDDELPDLVDQTVINILITLSLLIIFIMLVSVGWFLLREYKPIKKRLCVVGAVRYRSGSNTDLQGLVA